MSITTPGGLVVKKISSKAGYATTIHVHVPNTPDGILFDCGVSEESDCNVTYVFVTHGHVDHIGACISHARSRSMGKSPAKYYVPENCVTHLLDAKKAFEGLDEHEIAMDIRPMVIGQNISISKHHKVFAFPTKHRVKSHGYGIIHSTHALLPQYKGLPSAEIGSLKRQGVQVTHTVEDIELVYTGDTMFDALFSPGLEFIFTCPVLLIELTYIDGDISRAHKWEHIHLEECLPVIHQFHNEHIIFLHFSARYSVSRVIDTLSRRLPSTIRERCYAALYSLGSGEQLTYLGHTWERERERVGWGWGHPNERERERERKRGRGRSTRGGRESYTSRENHPPPPPPRPPFSLTHSSAHSHSHSSMTSSRSLPSKR